MERALGVCRKKIIPATTLIVRVRPIRLRDKNKISHLAMDPK
jgi:hypothetical protein